jgi:hypothetical protein
MKEKIMKSKIYIPMYIGLFLMSGFFTIALAQQTSHKVWGSTAQGMALSINVYKRYTLGKEINITADIINNSDKTIVMSSRNVISQYRLALFDQEGNPVNKTKFVIDNENKTNKSKPIIVMRNIAHRLDQGKQYSEQININDWFVINKAGTFQLVAMRKISYSWDDGFMISNLVKIEIEKPDK